MKISQAELQTWKRQDFRRFANLMFGNIFIRENYSKYISDGTFEALTKIQERIDLEINLFFSASDPTIKKYSEFIKYNSRKNQEQDPMKLLNLTSEVIIAMRQDIGYDNTKLKGEDFIEMLITDWGEMKTDWEKFKSNQKK